MATQKKSQTGDGVMLKFSFLSPSAERSGLGIINLAGHRTRPIKLEVVVSPVKELGETDISRDWFQLITEIRGHDLIEENAVIQTRKLLNDLELEFTGEESAFRTGILAENRKPVHDHLSKLISNALECADAEVNLVFDRVGVMRLKL